MDTILQLTQSQMVVAALRRLTVPPSCVHLLLQKSLGQCNAISGAAPGVPEGFCQKTCGRCTCTAASTPSTSSSNTPSTPSTPSPSTTTRSPSELTGTSQSKPTPCSCTDTQPDSKYTCAQQKAFGKCSDSFVAGKGNCQITCGECKCNPTCKCDDVQPPGSFTCAQQVNLQALQPS